MRSRRMPFGPGRTISRLIPLVLIGVLATGATAAGTADHSITPGTWEWPAPVAEAVEQTVESDASEAKIRFVSLDPAPSAGRLEMNLFEKGDFLKQATSSMCVARAAQTMMNMIDSGEPNRSVAYQKKLYTLGRQLSVNQDKLTSSGVDPSGWVALLNRKGYGPYVLESAKTRAGAMGKAATAIRETGRPVGLVVQAGRHAWVMSGFTATADPAFDKDFEVKAVYVQDPWYPSSGSISPNTLVRMSRLKQDYLPYQRGGLYPKREGKFMLILPVLPEDTVAA